MLGLATNITLLALAIFSLFAVPYGIAKQEYINVRFHQ